MSAPRLSFAAPRAAAADWPAYDAGAATIGVVHIGLGAFHRAHQAPVFDTLIARGDRRWGVCGVSLRNGAVGDALMAQDGLYTLAIREVPERLRVIGAVREALLAPRDGEKFAARLAAETTRIVTLTVTEAGYCLGADGALDFAHPDIEADLAAPRAPRSALGWIVEGLRRRRESGLPAFTVVSCDNLSRNGDLTAAALTALAEALDHDLAAWIAGEARCPNTMVDSITPKTDDALIARVGAALGVRDGAPVQREAFTQWVIEDGARADGPDWESAGVQLTADIAPFAQAKLSLLNGAHSALAYLGPIAGAASVSQAMGVDWLAAFVRRLMDEAAGALKPAPGLDLGAYGEAVRARFHNTAIEHRLEQIAMDGSIKLPIRFGPTIAHRLAAGLGVETQCLALAAWLRFLRRAVLAGRAIADPIAPRLEAIARRFIDEPAHDGAESLVLFADFAAHPDFAATLKRAYGALLDAERTGSPPALAR